MDDVAGGDIEDRVFSELHESDKLDLKRDVYVFMSFITESKRLSVRHERNRDTSSSCILHAAWSTAPRGVIALAKRFSHKRELDWIITGSPWSNFGSRGRRFDTARHTAQQLGRLTLLSSTFSGE